MTEHLEYQVETVPPLSTRLYSAAIVAAYTLLASIPVGLILYGLNLRSRGKHRFGGLMLFFGGIFSIGMIALALNNAPSDFALPGILVALYLYKMEDGPFNKAISNGAIRARWWPPALWVLAVMILLLVVGLFTTV